MEMLSALWKHYCITDICKENPPINVGFPSQTANNGVISSFYSPEKKTAEQTGLLVEIWDATMPATLHNYKLKLFMKYSYTKHL